MMRAALVTAILASTALAACYTREFYTSSDCAALSYVEYPYCPAEDVSASVGVCEAGVRLVDAVSTTDMFPGYTCFVSADNSSFPACSPTAEMIHCHAPANCVQFEEKGASMWESVSCNGVEAKYIVYDSADCAAPVSTRTVAVGQCLPDDYFKDFQAYTAVCPEEPDYSSGPQQCYTAEYYADSACTGDAYLVEYPVCVGSSTVTEGACDGGVKLYNRVSSASDYPSWTCMLSATGSNADGTCTATSEYFHCTPAATCRKYEEKGVAFWETIACDGAELKWSLYSDEQCQTLLNSETDQVGVCTDGGADGTYVATCPATGGSSSDIIVDSGSFARTYTVEYFAGPNCDGSPIYVTYPYYAWGVYINGQCSGGMKFYDRVSTPEEYPEWACVLTARAATNGTCTVTDEAFNCKRLATCRRAEEKGLAYYETITCDGGVMEEYMYEDAECKTQTNSRVTAVGECKPDDRWKDYDSYTARCPAGKGSSSDGGKKSSVIDGEGSGAAALLAPLAALALAALAHLSA